MPEEKIQEKIEELNQKCRRCIATQPINTERCGQCKIGITIHRLESQREGQYKWPTRSKLVSADRISRLRKLANQ